MKNRNVDMLNGPLLKPVIAFALPIVLTGVLQLFFNAADMIVIGRFAGSIPLAAVGSTGPLINLMVNLFIGISIGASVIMGRYVGAGDAKNAKDTLHTAIAVSMLGGILMLFVGVFFSTPMLKLMKTPDEVLKLSSLYLKIYFLCMPAFMVFNFGASLMRATGDTRRPLYFLSIAGVVNVLFNLFFVTVLKMSVAGVAIATVISQYISATLIILSLRKSTGYMRLNLKALRLSLDKVLEMLRIGLPAGLQGALFSISNMIIQSAINSFGPSVMAGNTAASNIEGFVYVGMNAVYQTSLSFTSQNMGAKQFDRISSILKTCIAVVTVVGTVMGVGSYLLGNTLLRFFTDDAEVIGYGLERMSAICIPYAFCGIMDVIVGSLRGMGYSIRPMLVSLTGICLLRIVYITTYFAAHRTPFVLYLSYIISWIVTIIGQLIIYYLARKKVMRSVETAKI